MVELVFGATPAQGPAVRFRQSGLDRTRCRSRACPGARSRNRSPAAATRPDAARCAVWEKRASAPRAEGTDRQWSGAATRDRRMTALRRRPGSWPAPPTLPANHLLSGHQAFIRALPCVACRKPPPSEYAHIGMPTGLSLSPSERDLLPLCGPATLWADCCHSRKWFLGASRFWAALGIDPLDLAFRLWRVSGDVEAGAYLVLRARQARSQHESRGGQAFLVSRCGPPDRSDAQRGKLSGSGVPESEASGEGAHVLE